jgi:hypothetical protein
MEQLGSHRTDFHVKFVVSVFVRKSAAKIQVPLQFDENSGY